MGILAKTADKKRIHMPALPRARRKSPALRFPQAGFSGDEDEDEDFDVPNTALGNAKNA